MVLANYSEHEKCTSDIISSDEEEGHATWHLPEKAEVRCHMLSEPSASSNTVSKACEMTSIIKPLYGGDDMGVEDFYY